jgi:aspartate beta-hydroxylase
MNSPEPQADASGHMQRGRACEFEADYAGARAAYAEALRLDPALFTARLHFGAVLERLRLREDALVQYRRALKDAQALGQWLDAATTPPLLRPLVQHAVEAIRAGHHELFERLFAPLRERYGRQSLDRVEHCIRVYLNEEPAIYPDPRQKPGFLYFPGLPTSAFFDRAQLPWADALEAAAPAILEELQRLLPQPGGRERVLSSDVHEAQSLRATLDAPPSWTGYYFYRHGERREDNCAACPRTAGALEDLPLCRVREHGPEVMFSVFTAGTHLLPHRGVTNTRSVGHLGLIVPPDCALRVGGEVYHWQPGKAMAFDDTFEHDAWNRSSATRVVLIFDIWNPFLTLAERAAVADLVAAIGDVRSTAEAG